MDFLKNVRKVVTPIRKAISLDLSLDKYLDQIFWFHTFRTDVSNRFNNWKQFFIQKCIIKHTNNYRADCLQLQKRDPKTWKHSRKVVHKSTNRETPVITYIFLKLYSPKTLSNWYVSLLQEIISDWTANALQVNKDNDQVIPLKLQGMFFTVFTKDSIDK